MNKTAVALVLVPVALALAACSSGGKKDIPRCPQTAVLRELSRVSDYGSDTPSPQNLVAAATMRGASGKCKYKDGGMEVDLSLDMTAMRGARLGGNSFSAPFFVAVVDGQSKVVSKETMTIEFILSERDKPSERTEKFKVFVPLSSPSDGEDYRVLAGFQMTRAQVEEIRKEQDRMLASPDAGVR